MSLFRFPDKTLDKNHENGEKLRVGIVPASRGAGASFVCSKILQEGLIGLPTPPGLKTLVELGNPYYYEALGMEKRFKERTFFDFESSEKYVLNLEMGINWYLRKDSKKISENALYKSISMAPGNLILYDYSGILDNMDLYNSLFEMDLVYLVIDPLPTKLIPSWAFIEKFKSDFPSCILVVNKFNDGIHKSSLSSFLGTKNYYTVDSCDFSHIYSCEYNCILP